ncbi:hypothetical protein BDR05DRAFT_523207 [Suillus weaverae]|nr:hypothetical protein BDR05DRAFT_523207 [Suillus weaverae]
MMAVLNSQLQGNRFKIWSLRFCNWTSAEAWWWKDHRIQITENPLSLTNRTLSKVNIRRHRPRTL